MLHTFLIVVLFLAIIALVAWLVPMNGLLGQSLGERFREHLARIEARRAPKPKGE